MAQREVVKKVKNAVLYSDGTMRIDGVRGSYVHLDKPYKGKPKPGDGDGPAKYSIIGIMPKETHVEAKDLIIEVIKKLLADNKDARVAKDKRFIRDGDDQEKDEYVDSWTISAREERRPKVRDRSGELIDLEDVADQCQSGYWYNVLIRPWFQDNDFGKRVNAGLVGVQFVRKDETFGDGAIDESDAWDTLGDDDDDGISRKKSRDDDDDDL
jgi:hypothetical protein